MEQTELLSTLARADAGAVKAFVEDLIPGLEPIAVLVNRTGLAMLPMEETTPSTVMTALAERTEERRRLVRAPRVSGPRWLSLVFWTSPTVISFSRSKAAPTATSMARGKAPSWATTAAALEVS